MLKPLALIIKKKYVVTIVVFAIWMLFFDGNSFLFIHHQNKELKDLKAQEKFLKKEIEEMNTQKNELFSNQDKLEKYARENFYFKRDNEDVYVLEYEED
ncbi:MAG: FtsB family cell division protein [Bacteroidia bacterium]